MMVLLIITVTAGHAVLVQMRADAVRCKQMEAGESE
jgi:hypothetical protein